MKRDLDPKNRPPQDTGAHWQVPEKQEAKVKIYKSPEHPSLTPVFGTSCPPRGVSGLLRSLAYRWSEGRNAHWLTLLLADRVDVIEGRLGDLLRGKLFNPIKESGILSEWKRKKRSP